MSSASWPSAFREGLLELVLLRHAEETTLAYRPEDLSALREAKREAARRASAARQLADPYAALAVLDAALSQVLRATHLARGAESSLDSELAWLTHASSLPAATVSEPLGFSTAEALREQRDALVRWALDHVESRTPLEIRALRFGRLVGLTLLVALLVGAYVREHFLVHDVALHKPVVTSPLKMNPPSGAEVVDGRTRGTFGVHTAEGHPFVLIDLEREYDVQQVRVYNRGDGWFDDVLPLTLSTSIDGERFDVVGERLDHFDVWTVDLGGKPARWVKVSKQNGYIALNEIEVYARP